MAKTRLVPKGCIVHSISKTGRGAEVRFRCHGETGSNWYPHSDGGGSNYPSKLVRGISSIRLPGGVGVSGTSASIHGFMHCHRERTEISCVPTSGGGFSGLRRARRRRR